MSAVAQLEEKLRHLDQAEVKYRAGLSKLLAVDSQYFTASAASTIGDSLAGDDLLSAHASCVSALTALSSLLPSASSLSSLSSSLPSLLEAAAGSLKDDVEFDTRELVKVEEMAERLRENERAHKEQKVRPGKKERERGRERDIYGETRYGKAESSARNFRREEGKRKHSQSQLTYLLTNLSSLLLFPLLLLLLPLLFSRPFHLFQNSRALRRKKASDLAKKLAADKEKKAEKARIAESVKRSMAEMKADADTVGAPERRDVQGQGANSWRDK